RAVISDNKTSASAISDAEQEYWDAWFQMYQVISADRQNFQVQKKYFDLVIAHSKAKTSLEDGAQDAFDKWQQAFLASEDVEAMSEELLKQSSEAKDLRRKVEAAQLDERKKSEEDMQRRMQEMIERTRRILDNK